MNRDSNSYTYLFAAIMVIVVASILAYTASSLRGRQEENVTNEKMQNILETIEINVSREDAKQEYEKYIVETLSLNDKGDNVADVNAFDVKLKYELKKPVSEQIFPLYIAEVQGNKYYIIPLRGAGLWDAIWGYIALEKDQNTIKGAIFDHKGETAGLGAEITQDWFQSRFQKEVVHNKSNELVGIVVSKSNNDPKDLDKSDSEVDAISGATITSDGVTAMIYERLSKYEPYFKKNKIAEVKEIKSTEEDGQLEVVTSASLQSSGTIVE